MRRLVFIVVMLVLTALHAQQAISSILEQIRLENIAYERDAAVCDSLISWLMEFEPGYAEKDSSESNDEYLSRITTYAPKIIGLRKQYTMNHLSILDSLRALEFDRQIALDMEFREYNSGLGRVYLCFRSPDYPLIEYFWGDMENGFAEYIRSNPDSLSFVTDVYINEQDRLALRRVIIQCPRGSYEAVIDPIDGIRSGVNVCFSDDGRSLAYYDRTGRSGFIDAILDNNRRIGFSERGRINCVAISPDGRYLAIGFHDNLDPNCKFRVWDIRDSNIMVHGGIEGEVNSVDISPDGRLLAIGGGQSTVTSTAQIYEVQTGRMLFECSDHKAISGVKFSPDQRYLAVTGASLTVWDLSTLEKYIYEESSDNLTCLDFHPDGTTLVTGKENKGFQIYNLETKQHKSYEGQLNVHSLCYDYLGRYLLVGADETKVLNLKRFAFVGSWEGSNSLFRPGSRRVIEIPY